ncbi:putative branched-chain-amino-acid aminotransferase [Bienertia sinuspersici]
MSTRFLFTNGVFSSSFDTPSITTFLETHSGAYTTTRTHNNGELLLFWDRHLKRLSNSLQILLNSNPHLLFGHQYSGFSSLSSSMNWDSFIRRRVNGAMRNALSFAIEGRNSSEELSISTLVGGKSEELKGVQGRIEEETIDRVLDVYVHIGTYVPPVFGVEGNAARLAVVGCRRDCAEAKYSDWARLRKPLELLRPPSATELLLSDNGDQILEGTITNFFVVRFKDHTKDDEKNINNEGDLHSYELQTAPVKDGVLPGVIRELVIEICLRKGIAVQEVSPSWSERNSWEEAFVTSSLRLLQHVETIQAPQSWTSVGSKSWKEVKWLKKHFKGSPGMITSLIQGEIMNSTALEGYPLALLRL